MNDYLALTKPRLTLMSAATAMSSFYIASEKTLDWTTAFYLLIGIALVGGGSNALNQYMERDSDALMPRTQKRPLPSKKITSKNALIFGALLTFFGTAYLLFFINFLSAIIGAATCLIYLFAYTPLKKKTWLNTFVGAISGALPCLIGWAAAGGSFVKWPVYSLFFLLFVWQLPHFFAIAWVYKEDYKAGGYQMLSTIDRDGKKSAFSIAIFSVLLFIASLLPALSGVAGSLYLTAAIMSGLLFLAFTLYSAAHKIAHAREIIKGSIMHLGILNLFLLFDKI